MHVNMYFHQISIFYALKCAFSIFENYLVNYIPNWYPCDAGLTWHKKNLITMTFSLMFRVLEYALSYISCLLLSHWERVYGANDNEIMDGTHSYWRSKQTIMLFVSYRKLLSSTFKGSHRYWIQSTTLYSYWPFKLFHFPSIFSPSSSSRYDKKIDWWNFLILIFTEQHFPL
jgi:hypothetical protein